MLFYQYVEPVWSARRQKQSLAEIHRLAAEHGGAVHVDTPELESARLVSTRARARQHDGRRVRGGAGLLLLAAVPLCGGSLPLNVEPEM